MPTEDDALARQVEELTVTRRTQHHRAEPRR